MIDLTEAMAGAVGGEPPYRGELRAVVAEGRRRIRRRRMAVASAASVAVLCVAVPAGLALAGGPPGSALQSPTGSASADASSGASPGCRTEARAQRGRFIADDLRELAVAQGLTLTVPVTTAPAAGEDPDDYRATAELSGDVSGELSVLATSSGPLPTPTACAADCSVLGDVRVGTSSDGRTRTAESLQHGVFVRASLTGPLDTFDLVVVDGFLTNVVHDAAFGRPNGSTYAPATPLPLPSSEHRSPPPMALCPPAPLRVSDEHPRPGETITVSAGAFTCDQRWPAGKTYTLLLNLPGGKPSSDGRAVPIDPDGSFSATVTIPADAAAGSASITIPDSNYGEVCLFQHPGALCASYDVAFTIG